MVYSAEISRNNPTCFFFLIDQSTSMEDVISGEKTKAQFLSDVLNKTFSTIITRCTKDPTGIPRDYFEIGVAAYGYDGVYPGLSGELSSNYIHKLSEIYEKPLRIEERAKKVDDGAGGLVEQKIKFPVWFEPKSYGNTPMCEALNVVSQQIQHWVEAHPNSYPPTIIHVTDGEANDGNPEEPAEILKQNHTSDGYVLLYNLHVDVFEGKPVAFPSSDTKLPSNYAKQLFRMSSNVPDNQYLINAATERGFNIDTESKFFFYNADMEFIVNFFEIGTSPSATQFR